MENSFQDWIFFICFMCVYMHAHTGISNTGLRSKPLNFLKSYVVVVASYVVVVRLYLLRSVEAF